MGAATDARASTVLIGGAPGVGKTTTARALAGRLGWTAVTFDDVMTGVRAATDPDTHPDLHPQTRAGGYVAYFTDSTPADLVATSEALERATWPILRALVTSHLRDARSSVVDWWLLRPRDVVDFEPGRVGSIWITVDPEVIRRRERAHADVTAPSPDPARMLDNFIGRSLWRNELVASEAAELGLPVLRLDGTEPVDQVVDLVLAAIS